VADSFWAIPDAAGMRTPVSILREQASATISAQPLVIGCGTTSAGPSPPRWAGLAPRGPWPMPC
jgi:hypothetical protein